jgi:phosphate transport system permease protein
VENTQLPAYGRKTTFRVKFVDKAANIGITVGGLGVILAVVGLIVFIGWQVIPLFAAPEVGEATEPLELGAGDTMFVHTDEYRGVGLRIERNGYITTFAMATGEVITRERPELLGDATLTVVRSSIRARTLKMVGSTLDVPHRHLLLGTSDGRVLVGDYGYVIGFRRFGMGEDPLELAALTRPEDEAFRHVSYVPDILVQDGAVVEHLPSFGLYRTNRVLVNIDREMDVDTGGSPIRLLEGQISRGGEDDDRTTTTLVGTEDGRLLLVRETISVNMFTGDQDVRATTDDITERVSPRPDYVLVNEQQDQLFTADRSGLVHHFQWNRSNRRFEQPFEPFSIFAPQADEREGRHWRSIVNEMRRDLGYEPVAEDPELTAVEWVLGEETILFGDSMGGIQAWMLVNFEDRDAAVVWRELKRNRPHEPGKGAITHIFGTPISKSFSVVDASGTVRAINNTSERVYFHEVHEGAKLAIFNRKADAIIAINEQGSLRHWWLDAPHVDQSWRTLFGKVWYEGYTEPRYEWQSTAGTDDVEAKLSLIPLILGTIKGALYALLLAVPLAVLAAVYTSEFMHRNIRAILKPAMEVMASLPSVVLGFLAALYFAPKAAPMMPTLIMAAFTIPATFMVFGWIWQRCPPSFVGKFGHVSSTALLFALLALAIYMASLAGPRAEVFLFPAVEGADPALLHPETFQPLNEDIEAALATGDFRRWTGGGRTLSRPNEMGPNVLPEGWWIPGGSNLLIALLAIPLTLLLGLAARMLMPKLRGPDGMTAIERARRRLEGERADSMRAVGIDTLSSILFGLLLVAGGFLLAMLIGPYIVEPLLFSYDHPTAGKVGDFRRFVTGEDGWRFEQSNSLIVGFAMGFAVIPLIYTISEDALTSVPNQLRAASLACGASRWQTTITVVLPAAASGIFSGIVIGLGRALGETMIVVMAAGGTPIMELQPLSGFRSLSAAIAIEMPEAPHGGTLYRVLFLGGLILFVMAFVMNTMAELVRMRLRKRLSRL